MICVKFTTFCDLQAELRIRLATLRQVRTQVLVLQTSIDLRRPAGPFGQGFKALRQQTAQLSTAYKTQNILIIFMPPYYLPLFILKTTDRRRERAGITSSTGLKY